MLVPGYTLILELTVLRFAAARPATARLWRWLYGVVCVAAVLVTVFYVFPHYATPGSYARRDFTALERELTQLRALPMYLYWCVLPLPSHFAFYYDNYVASTGLLHPATTLYGALLLTALLGLALALRKKRPLFALGIGWFFVAHALTSSPIALELVFEHRNYPALLGVILAVADLVRWLVARTGSRTPVVIACTVLFAFMSLTAVRAATWGSKLLLATTLTDKNPGSVRASQDLARVYMAMSGGTPDSPLYSLSIRELERGAGLGSNSPLPEEALLIQAARYPGQIDTQKWWSSLIHKLQTRTLIPDTYAALHNLLQARTHGANIDAQQLAHAYAIAVSRNPGRNSLRAEYAELSGAILGDTDLAIEQWKQVLKRNKDLHDYAPRLAMYLLDEGRNREAVAVVDEALQLQPALRKSTPLPLLRQKALAKGNGGA